MNCPNCGSRMTSTGCLCRPSGNATDLLGKLERSNDAWIAAQEEIDGLQVRLAPIYNVWQRWQDFIRTSYPTVEQTHHALYDFGNAIRKSMEGYNPPK